MRFRILFFSGALVVLLYLATIGGVPATAASDVIRIGISKDSISNVNPDDALAAFKTWADTVIKEQNLQERIEITLFDSIEELRRRLLQDQIEAVSVSTRELVQIGVQPEDVYLLVNQQGMYVRFVLLVNRNSGITSVDKLQGRRLVLHHGQRMNLSRTWLESLVTHSSGESTRRWLGDLNYMGNPSNIIFQVFFRQTDAAVVAYEAFELACELNPQLRRELVILHESQQFIDSFLMFRPTWREPARDNLEDAIRDLHTTPGGLQVLTVFQSSQIVRHPRAILDDTLLFIRKHGIVTDDLPFEISTP